jgi:RNA recognition motif-containing protein
MKLYVGNLPWSVDDRALKELFNSFGDIEEAVLIKDKFSGRSKGFGFITFKEDAAAQKAVTEMHEKEVDGRPLTVSEARPMVPRDNAPRGTNNEETSEAPVANPSAINQNAEGIDNETAPEVADENSDASGEEKKIESVEEAMEDASEDKPATEKALEAN